MAAREHGSRCRRGSILDGAAGQAVTDADQVEETDDLEDLVQDKRAGWRADSALARRRQRRYKNLLTRQIAVHGAGGDEDR